MMGSAWPLRICRVRQKAATKPIIATIRASHAMSVRLGTD